MSTFLLRRRIFFFLFLTRFDVFFGDALGLGGRGVQLELVDVEDFGDAGPEEGGRGGEGDENVVVQFECLAFLGKGFQC